jgi:hypothetical protein
MPDLHARLLARVDLDDEDNHAGFRCGSIDALRTVVDRCAYIVEHEDQPAFVDFADSLLKEIASALGVEATDG